MRGRRFRPAARRLVVQVRGTDLEAFINGCVQLGLRLWGVERPGRDLLIVRMDADGFARLRRLRNRAGWEIRIVERRGGGFLLRRLLRRRAFLWGGLAAACLAYFLSLHIWFVRVEGTERVDPQAVLELAREAGLAPGVRRAGVDADEVQRTLLIGLEDLVWAGLELRGTRAVITVAERRLPEEADQGPGHIVAARDGVVERIAVVAGTPDVAEGDTVRAGQVLISGLLPPGTPEFSERVAQGEAPYVRAQGSVRAVVWYEAVAQARIAGAGVEEARRSAALVAAALAQEAARAGGAEPAGEPAVEIETDESAGTVRARALVQAIQEIGVFEAVIP